MRENETKVTRKGFLGRLIWVLPVLLGFRSKERPRGLREADYYSKHELAG